jgi:hypothetical protein
MENDLQDFSEKILRQVDENEQKKAPLPYICERCKAEKLYLKFEKCGFCKEKLDT